MEFADHLVGDGVADADAAPLAEDRGELRSLRALLSEHHMHETALRRANGLLLDSAATVLDEHAVVECGERRGMTMLRICLPAIAVWA